MSIVVTCPSCLKRFQVSEKFAGKSGPCPSCKQILKVPDKSQEVVVHAPKEFESGGRGVTGKLALKPIAREETKINALMVVSIIGAVALIFIAAFIGNKANLFKDNIVSSAIGLLLISPLAVVAAYTFLRDDELEPYRGKSLYLRSLICALAYVVLWGVFAYAAPKIINPEYIWTWLILFAPLLIAGTAAAWATLDLEPGNAFFHYVFYLLVTIILRWVAGMGWIWQINQG